MKMLTILLLSVLMLSGCSGDFLESRIQDINSGTYHVSGIQVELTYDFPWPSWGGKEVILSRDTTEIEFTVEIEYPSDPLGKQKKDMVRFRGLEGADVGEYTATSRSNCTPPFCYADAKLSGSELTFNLESVSGDYTGQGDLEAGALVLEAHFEYRGIGIDYFLEGEKID